jgi:hypothetical protein
MKKRLALVLTAAILLTACGTASMAENAGKAMAETACIIFEDPSKIDTMSEESDAIMKKYGFEQASDIDDYLLTIQGTEELNTVSATARDTLISTCGAALEEKGVDASDLATAMVSQ